MRTIRRVVAALAATSASALCGAACSSDAGSSATTTIAVQDLLSEAQRLRDSGDVAGAEAVLQQAVDAAPTNAVAIYNLALIQRDRNRFDEAAENLWVMVELRPSSIEARLELVRALRDAGRLDEAVTAGREALDEFPDQPTLMNVVGSILVSQGRFDEGDRLVMAALRMMPELEGTGP